MVDGYLFRLRSLQYGWAAGLITGDLCLYHLLCFIVVCDVNVFGSW